MVELAMPELDKALEEHEKNPEKHPLYPAEWKKFWNRRYIELQAGMCDRENHSNVFCHYRPNNSKQTKTFSNRKKGSQEARLQTGMDYILDA